MTDTKDPTMTPLAEALVRNLKIMKTEVVLDKSSFIRVGIMNYARQVDDNVKKSFDNMIEAIDSDLCYIRGLLDDAECGRLDEVFEFGILVDE